MKNSTSAMMIAFCVLVLIGLFQCTDETANNCSDAYRSGWMAGKEACVPYCGAGECLRFIAEADSIMAGDIARWNAQNPQGNGY